MLCVCWQKDVLRTFMKGIVWKGKGVAMPWFCVPTIKLLMHTYGCSFIYNFNPLTCTIQNFGHTHTNECLSILLYDQVMTSVECTTF